jgi:hypothetical protein
MLGQHSLSMQGAYDVQLEICLVAVWISEVGGIFICFYLCIGAKHSTLAG